MSGPGHGPRRESIPRASNQPCGYFRTYTLSVIAWLAIAEVVRDLHRNAGQPDQSFSERQIYEAAMERLAAELAALDKTDKATAATKLTDFLKTV